MIKEDNDFKLMPSPVPDSCWYSNLRAHLPAKVWDLIRKDAYAKANGRCMICNRPVKRLEAHEDWSYDEVNHIQKLERVVAICHSCHSVIHIGRTQLLGDEDKAIAHFCKVNKCGFSDYIRELSKANEEHRRRNLVPEWSTDMRKLEEILTTAKK